MRTARCRAWSTGCVDRGLHGSVVWWLSMLTVTVMLPCLAIIKVRHANFNAFDAVMNKSSRVWNLMMKTCGIQRHNMEFVPKMCRSTIQSPIVTTSIQNVWRFGLRRATSNQKYTSCLFGVNKALRSLGKSWIHICSPSHLGERTGHRCYRMPGYARQVMLSIKVLIGVESLSDAYNNDTSLKSAVIHVCST